MFPKISFFHSENCSLLMPNLLERCSTVSFNPSTIDDLALSQDIVDGCLYLGPLVINFLSLLLRTILRSPVMM